MRILSIVRKLAFAAALATALAAPNPASAAEAIEQTHLKDEVSVLGRVNYPGRFRLSADEKLGDILKRAGGASAEANGVVTISRTDENGVRSKIDLSITNDASFKLKPGDIIVVRPAK